MHLLMCVDSVDPEPVVSGVQLLLLLLLVWPAFFLCWEESRVWHIPNKHSASPAEVSVITSSMKVPFQYNEIVTINFMLLSQACELRTTIHIIQPGGGGNEKETETQEECPFLSWEKRKMFKEGIASLFIEIYFYFFSWMRSSLFIYLFYFWKLCDLIM